MGNRAPADASTGVLFFTNLAQWRRAGNRAPTDGLIESIVFTSLARERQAGNNSLQATETTA